MSDYLADMLREQRRLQVESFGLDPCRLTGEERAEFIRWNVLALEDELHEVLQEVGWKPWATSRHVHYEPAMSELVDAWHFFMNLLLVISSARPCGVGTAETLATELRDGYLAKRRVNAKRQEDGYDGVRGKCPTCKRDLAAAGIGVEQLVDAMNHNLTFYCSAECAGVE